MSKAKKTAKAKGEKSHSPGKPKHGRKPVEHLMFNLFGTALMQVGVVAANRKRTRSIGIMSRAEFEALAKKSEDSPSPSTSGRKTAEEKVETPPADPVNPVVVLKVNKARQAYPLDAGLYDQYKAFCKAVEDARGIHAVCVVSLKVVIEHPHTNVYYLNPVDGPPDNSVPYRVLHDSLSSEGLAIVVLYVSGNGVEPAAVVPSENGLVMWVLPEPGLSNDIGEAVGPAWKTAEVEPAAAREMARILVGRRVLNLRPKHRVDPRTQFLEHVADAAQEAADAPIPGSTQSYPSLLDALKATK